MVSKRRLVITAVLTGQSQSEVARTYGVSQGWISRLMRRYAEDGEAAFEPRSRRPESSPNATTAATVALIIGLRKELTESGLDAGPETIGWHLTHHHQREVSRATISRETNQPSSSTSRSVKSYGFVAKNASISTLSSL